jgi:hypothetical protein
MKFSKTIYFLSFKNVSTDGRAVVITPQEAFIQKTKMTSEQTLNVPCVTMGSLSSSVPRGTRRVQNAYLTGF